MAKELEFKLRGDFLPADTEVTSFGCVEGISTVFELDVDFTTSDASFVVEDALRKGATLVIESGRRQRTISGICDRAEFVHHDRYFHFRIRLRPQIAALAHREDNRIYQDQSIVDVVREVFAAAGVDKVEWQLLGTYEPKEFIVQYRETELNFVSRLMENEGIFYFFEHEEGEAKMIVSDDINCFLRELPYPPTLGMQASAEITDVATEFARTTSLRTSNTRLRDYDFEKPQSNPDAHNEAVSAWPMPYFEYPAGFTKAAEGSQRATARLKSLRADADVAHGASRCFVLEVAGLFSMDGARQEYLNMRYVVTELHTHGHQDHFGQSSVSNRWKAIPEGAAYAPPIRAYKPRIDGLQTATVMGPTNEEQSIHVDKYGRVKVRFHWDRVGQRDDSASCWLRVTQVPLGGSIILPRVSWELSVAFFDGDPDKPFALGRVYNAEKSPPYALPGTQTSGSIKSMSSPGGAGHNEINLADSGGTQGFSTHAQKDMNTNIGANKTEHVAVDENQNIKVNRKQMIGANQITSIAGNQVVDIGAVASQKISGGQKISVGGNSKDNATANLVEKIGVDRSYDVGGNMTVISNTVLNTIAANLNRDVGTAMVSMSIASISDTFGGDYNEEVSLVHLTLCKGAYNETVTGSKNITAAAADVHLVKGNWAQSCEASVTHLVGGLHYQKVAGEYSVKAPIVALIGAVGELKGGGSVFKLGGGPVVMMGSKIAVETALLVKLGGSLKLG